MLQLPHHFMHYRTATTRDNDNCSRVQGFDAGLHSVCACRVGAATTLDLLVCSEGVEIVWRL
jgi:hypothetical protein